MGLTRSLLRTAKKHKKSRRLGKPEVMAREEYGELEVDVKIEMIRSLIPLGLMHVHELLDDEVKELAGERYARKDELERGRRHGTNPGTVGLAGQRVPIRVPRVRSQEGVEIPLRSYEALNDGGEVNDLLLKRVEALVEPPIMPRGRGQDLTICTSFGKRSMSKF